jgi:hypothetical protein
MMNFDGYAIDSTRASSALAATHSFIIQGIEEAT